MKPITTIAALAMVLLSACSSQPNQSNVTSANTEELPNIVLILSDDQAWNDYGFMGHDVIKTPALDKLAKEGVTFTRGYVPTALCRPSLATISTGLYAHQHGINGNNPSAKVPGGKKGKVYKEKLGEIIAKIDKVKTLPQMLKAKGYTTFQSGKWWEGSYQRGGFDEGMTRGFPNKGGRHGDVGLKIGRTGIAPVTNFIDKATAANKPFFVWYAPMMPHTPHNPPERLLKKYRDPSRPESVARYYAMVEWFDETNGQLFDHLEKKGLKENTLIVYVCDNGWITNPKQAERFVPKSKQSPSEGGVRTPIMFSLPSKLAPQMRTELTSSIDIVPTILAAAGIEVPADLPGKNLLENMVKQTPIERDTIYGEGFAHDIVDLNDPEASLMYRWVIEGNWKLIVSYDGKNESYQKYHKATLVGPRLYDLSKDESEEHDLSAQHPELVERLKKKIADWYPLKHRKMITD